MRLIKKKKMSNVIFGSHDGRINKKFISSHIFKCYNIFNLLFCEILENKICKISNWFGILDQICTIKINN